MLLFRVDLFRHYVIGCLFHCFVVSNNFSSVCFNVHVALLCITKHLHRVHLRSSSRTKNVLIP